jgi:peptide-methionine (S)-S-oxide reductase
LSIFWSTHNPTTPFKQGNDCGTQYRSAVYYYSDGQKSDIEATKEAYAKAIVANGVDAPICTEIAPAPEFYYAEGTQHFSTHIVLPLTDVLIPPDAHQQYDAKPGSREYCGLQPLGIGFPAGTIA